MRYIGIDYGTKRVGVALSDESETIACPYTVVKNSDRLIDQLAEICKKEGVGAIVMGESFDLKGKPNSIYESARVCAEKLAEVTGLLVSYEPEFMSSQQVERLGGGDELIDARAASVILQSFLDKKKFSSAR